MDEAAENKVSREMPRYKCHKEVWALKIARLELRDNPNTDLKAEFGYMEGSLWLHPADEGYAPFQLPAAWREQWQRKADAGGYYVVYSDGYESYSPAKAFEEGYSLVPSDFKGRVQAEKAELDGRLSKLLSFTAGTTFASLPADEQERMRLQASCMQAYSNVLGERIEAFV